MKSLSLFPLVLAMAGCAGAKLGSPGFYCHASDNPACPDGQLCVDGRCVDGNNRNFGTGTDLAGASGDFGAGTPKDLAMAGTSHDLSQGTVGGMTGCLGELKCTNKCPTGAGAQACIMTCTANTTAAGDSLFQSLLNCVSSACPGASPGDPCFNSGSTTCSNCVMSSQMPGGQCASAQMACANDTP